MRISAKGETGLYAAAGKIIGQSQATQREIERAERVQEQLRSIAASKEMAQFNHQLVLDKAKFNMMMDVEAEKRAKAWEIEKMELRSRMDFAEDEQNRLQRNKEYDLAIKQLNENPIYARLTPEEKLQAKQILEMRKYTTAPVFQQDNLTEEEQLRQDMRKAMFGEEVPAPDVSGKKTGVSTTGQETSLEIINSKTGERGTIPVTSQAIAEAQGWQVVRTITPETTTKEGKFNLTYLSPIANIYRISKLLGAMRGAQRAAQPKQKPAKYEPEKMKTRQEVLEALQPEPSVVPERWGGTKKEGADIPESYKKFAKKYFRW